MLFGNLQKAKNNFEKAKAEGNIEDAKKFARECANTERQLAREVPDQMKAHLEKAGKWEAISVGMKMVPRKVVVERDSRSEQEGMDDDQTGFGESLIETSKVTWRDIGGLADVKSLIMETIAIAGLNKPESIRPDKGILLFGPPGTGKTLLAAAAAGSLKATFFNVKISSILSKYFGESSRLISALYDSARSHAPSIVFIDELDSITLSRDGDQGEASRKVLATLLSELDGFQDKKSDALILTLSATNTPWSLDDAVLSRFPKRIYIPLPDKQACQEIIRIQTKGLDITNIHLEQLGESCVNQHYSGRDLQNVCRESIKIMIRRCNKQIFDDIERIASLPFQELQKKTLHVEPLSMDDFTQSIARIKSPLTLDDIRRQEEWNRQFGAS